jgi:hypothetical protein
MISLPVTRSREAEKSTFGEEESAGRVSRAAQRAANEKRKTAATIQVTRAVKTANGEQNLL